ncbi:unnamed protein product [Hydatigera taeniaeformis]|uniref:DUF5727 domain-containing protein n=1 Tax=Hydatigena taeniaeformis TaxID=6205 RepID=A0A0R3WZ57_HYDTA|nr:unnamed protein product [Hydatigera taeniaeformis]
MEVKLERVTVSTSATRMCKLIDLVKDEKADLRVFHGVFPTKTNVTRESFRLVGNTTYVIVSVDYTQNGTSPEVAECNRKLSTARIASSPQRTTPHHTSPYLFTYSPPTCSTDNLNGMCLAGKLKCLCYLWRL